MGPATKRTHINRVQIAEQPDSLQTLVYAPHVVLTQEREQFGRGEVGVVKYS